MMLVLTYIVNYENSKGDIVEAEADVKFPNILEKDEKFTESGLEETSRRYLIGKIVENGGRVIKLRREGHRWIT